jgi:hypothetical protein
LYGLKTITKTTHNIPMLIPFNLVIFGEYSFSI